MALIEKGEFTIESSFDNKEDIRMNQRVDIRIRHKLSGRSPLVFRVDLLANGPLDDETEPINHSVLITRKQAYLLVAYQLSYDIEHRFDRPRIFYEYINADYFKLDDLKGPDRYKIYPTSSSYIFGSLPASLKVGESRHYRAYDPYQGGWDDWFDEVKDEGDMRVFAVRCSKGANRIAFPKDLRPFVGKMTSGKKSVFAEKDLTKAIDFETYSL